MLTERLKVFIDGGLIRKIPTRWQLFQGEIEMSPYVWGPDVTAEDAYARPFGHPVVRQPLIFSQVGLDHLGTGSALGARLESLAAHLQLTYHRGMPVFDLQVVQTHEGGLRHLRRSIEDIVAQRTPLARRRLRLAHLIIADPTAYYAKFLGDDGWIARAARLDYPLPADEGSNFPIEFFSLVGLVNYCAETFPERPRDVAWRDYPRHLFRLAGRRYRETGGLGWGGKA